MRRREVPAVPPGVDPSALAASLRSAHEAFVTTGALENAVRPVVASSWRRSARNGVDPEQPLAPVDLTTAELVAYRRDHPLAAAMPAVRRLLVDGAVGDGIVTALTDDVGRLLWVEGDGKVRKAVDRVGFVEGASWGEEYAGTNAPGTAIAARRALQVFSAEHFTRSVQPWSCSAVPVRDLATRRVLGVLDVTGGDHVASGLMLSLVRATVMAVELELAAATGALRIGAGEQDPRAGVGPRAPGTARLEVLGQNAGILHGPDPGASKSLSLRHAELLLLLAANPRGLSGEELAVHLHQDHLSDVTVRAEVWRLRRAVGPLLGESRPYRLAVPLFTDADAVRTALASGDVLGALASYPGPMLVRSRAPGVERLRAELSAELRASVLASQDPRALERWVATDEGAEDWQAWQALARLSTTGSPRWARAHGRLDLLSRELGVGPARHLRR